MPASSMFPNLLVLCTLQKKNNLSSKVQVLILNSNPRNMFIKLILHWMAFFIIINIMETTKNSLFN